MHLFLNFIFGRKLYMFRTVPLSFIRIFSLYTQQCYMLYMFADGFRVGSWWNHGSILILFASCQQIYVTYTIAVCTVKNPWWWTEELSETCKFSFQKKIWEISASSWFYYTKFVTMHGHVNVRSIAFFSSSSVWTECDI